MHIMYEVMCEVLMYHKNSHAHNVWGDVRIADVSQNSHAHNVWGAVLLFIPYLCISIIHFRISIIHFWISINELRASIINLRISFYQFMDILNSAELWIAINWF